MKPRAALSLILLLSGALTSMAGPAVDPQITSALSSRGVDDSTYNKVYHARPLDYADIFQLVSHKVPSKIIVGYLESTEKVYNLTSSQLASLRSAGASAQVLNYLGETGGFYGQTTPQQAAATGKKQADKYYNSRLEQDQAPFAYNAPAIDDWYDSGYEESLYSPFSFDN